jgi:hypothetical protein
LQPAYFNQLTPYFFAIYVLVLWVDILLPGLLISIFPRQMKAFNSAEMLYQSNKLPGMSTQHCKGKGLPVICHGGTEGLGLTPRPGRFPRAQEPRYRLYWRLGRPHDLSGRVWKIYKYLAPIWFRTPNFRTRSKLLYLPRHPGP